MKKYPKLLPIGLLLVAALLGLGLFFRFSKKLTMVDLGNSIVNLLRNRDSNGLANLVDKEELKLVGLDHSQAVRLIEEFVLPNASSFTDNIAKISVAGNQIVFEKRVGDPLFKSPPMMVLPRGGDVHVVSISSMLFASWNIKQNQMMLEGKPREASIAYLTAQFARARSLGMTKVLDWNDHHIDDLPTVPYTSTRRED